MTIDYKTMVRTVSSNQDEIINGILKLHCPNGIELDPTYSKGYFYKNIEKPKYRFDLMPQSPDVHQANCTDLPFGNDSVQSIMFDPPFLGGRTKNAKCDGIMHKRFYSYPSIGKLWEMYRKALEEFYRILKPNGILIFKCQDCTESNGQYFTEFKVIKDALEIGYYPKDKFILTAKSRLTSPRWKTQHHARKFHSYFLVFVKDSTANKIPY